MPRPDDVRSAFVAAAPAGAWTALGTAVPAGMRRYIWGIQTRSLAAANTLAIRLSAAGAAVLNLYHLGAGDMWDKPDKPSEDSLPLLIAESAAQVAVNPDAGACDVKVWYTDEY